MGMTDPFLPELTPGIKTILWFFDLRLAMSSHFTGIPGESIFGIRLRIES
jgi:hypothetical protein